jgi:glycosyltransferase involved in cell wall biosynthesis
MHILHVTPHLPPDQAANALLPWQLGMWAVEAGDSVAYVAHAPRAAGQADLAGPVAWVPRRGSGGWTAALRADLPARVVGIRRALRPALERADVVHVHSNGLLAELAVLLAVRQQRPVVLTLYGTEIWHYQPKRIGPDLFTRAYRAASIVTFYSERLLAHACSLGLTRRRMETVYPAVSSRFVWHDGQSQSGARAQLDIPNRHLLLNVKRLHPLAGQRDLLAALSDVVRVHPDTRLIICGTGPLLDELKSWARSCGVERHVTFAGLVDNARIATYCAAADLFVLPSKLEALPTVAVEALAAGTPVISSDNPGGVELNDLFGPDVAIVPKEQPMALGAAIVRFLEDKRRTSASTRATIDREFSAPAVAARYRALYERAIGGETR